VPGETTLSRTPTRAGDQFTISLSTPVPVGCTFHVFVNDREVRPGDVRGDLKVVGFGASGTVTFEARTASPNARVTISVVCQGGRGNREVVTILGHGWAPPPSRPVNPDQGRPLPQRFDEDVTGPDSHRQPH
jgi:hypothetical protein